MSGTTDGLRLEVGDVADAGPRALSARLEQRLRDAVRQGRLREGTALPSTRALAGDLGVSRGVVVRAYEQLTAEGYLRSRRGSGTVVAAPPTGAATAAATVRRLHPANPGTPELAWFPRTEWARAIDVACRSVAAPDLDYGDPRGHPRLREALAAHLGRTRSVVAEPDAIVVTAGFAQGLRLVGEVLRAEGIDCVGVEDPGSIGVVATLRAAGQQVAAIPLDDLGPDLDRLRASRARAVVVTPAHQFPTGIVMGSERRRALLDWATDRDGIVVEDDYDADYRYDRAPVGSLQGLDPGRVVHGSSVSKILAPGLRLGWLVLPPSLAPAVAESKLTSDISTPAIPQLALAHLLESGAVDRHVRRTLRRYAHRRDALVEAVATHLPGWEVTGIAAGLHAVLRPVSDDARPLGTTQRLHAVPLSALHHGSPGTRASAALVIGYGSAAPDQIDRAIAELATG